MLNLGRNAIQALSGSGASCTRRQAPRLILRTRVAGNVEHRRPRATGWSPRFNSRTTAPACSPEIRDTIFYPLVSGRADGSGLGLGIAQDLVSRHGGLIEFDSAPGRTIFVIYLPMDRA